MMMMITRGFQRGLNVIFGGDHVLYASSGGFVTFFSWSEPKNDGEEFFSCLIGIDLHPPLVFAAAHRLGSDL